jgi:hypothetical protein
MDGWNVGFHYKTSRLTTGIKPVVARVSVRKAYVDLLFNLVLNVFTFRGSDEVCLLYIDSTKMKAVVRKAPDKATQTYI